MKVFCKKTYFSFKRGEHYKVNAIHTIFEPHDFITLENICLCRFRLNKSKMYVEDYLGVDEVYFHDYFCDLKEERRIKLENLYIK